MKSFHAQTVSTAFAILTCASLVVAQGVSDPPATGYTYSAVNSPGASGTLAYGINNAGKIVGYFTGGECSVVSTQSSCGFVDVKGKFTTVACELENATDFFDVSNTSKIVGAYSFFGGVHGLIWEGNESCSSIVDPAGPSLTEAWGVNASGLIVGFYEDSAGNFRGFLYDKGHYTNIECAGWANTRAFGINDAGVIVGDVSASTSGPFHGFVYKSGKCTVFSYPKAASTSARGINKSGQVSGWYTDTSSKNHGFVRTGTSFAALNYPGATGTLAYHLNDQGQVAGFYAATNASLHGFIATPK
jgi:uncharacterized membrane protein